MNRELRRTSRGTDASSQRHERRDILLKNGHHALEKDPAHARMAANERINTNEDRCADPSLGHRERIQRVRERERRCLGLVLGHMAGMSKRGKDTGVLVLEQRLTEDQVLVRPRVG